MKVNSKILSHRRPKLCKEWNYKKNRPLTPHNVRFDSHKKVDWICSNGHDWKMRINRRTIKYENCPKCRRLSYSFLRQSKRLMSEWDCDKNKGIDPNAVKMASNKMYSWKCKNCRRGFKAQPNNRKNGTDCPYCSGNRVSKENSLVKNYPKLMKEWDWKKNKNIDPLKLSFGSSVVASWICPKCKNSWKNTICHRTGGVGCPYCKGIRVRTVD